MTPHADASVADIAARLARLEVRAWRGLPADLAWHAADEAAAAMLGDALEPAEVVSLDTPPSASAARAWLRSGYVVLIDVALESEATVSLVTVVFGEPERRLDVTYGLRPLPSGEWVYAARGLALVVDGEHVRHAMGFVACEEPEYQERLRVRFATTRRPLDSAAAKEGL
jgi:hypothetical protein